MKRHAADALICFGLVAVVAGCWLVFPPAALIVGGALLIFLVILGGTHGSSG